MKLLKIKFGLFNLLTVLFVLLGLMYSYEVHADPEIKSKEGLAQEIEALKKKLEEKEKSITIIIQNDLKNDSKSESNASASGQEVARVVPMPIPIKASKSKIKWGVLFSASPTVQLIENKLIAFGTHGVSMAFFEYKLSDWFGLRSGAATSGSKLTGLLSDKYKVKQLLNNEELVICHFSIPQIVV